MDIAVDRTVSASGESLEHIRAAGDRLMSLSDLRYEGQYVPAGGFQRIHAMEFGDGPPVLLVHGAGSSGAIWHRQIAALAIDHRVVVPDVPMFGMSEIPDRVHAPRAQIGDVILGVMDALSIDVADIAGHSLGALGSIGAMTREPERFNRAVLMSSPGFGRGLNWLLRLASVRMMQRFIRYDSRRDRTFFFDRFEAQRSGASDEREMWKELHFRVGSRNGAVDSFHQGMGRFTGLFGQRDLLSEVDLATIKASTLFIWGDSDKIIPTRHSKKAVKSLPNARLEILEDCGHLVQLEAPHRVTQLMVDWFRVS